MDLYEKLTNQTSTSEIYYKHITKKTIDSGNIAHLHRDTILSWQTILFWYNTYFVYYVGIVVNQCVNTICR